MQHILMTALMCKSTNSVHVSKPYSCISHFGNCMETKKFRGNMHVLSNTMYVKGFLLLGKNYYKKMIKPVFCFDVYRVPRKSKRPEYAYKEVVRKKDKRRQLNGFTCQECIKVL